MKGEGPLTAFATSLALSPGCEHSSVVKSKPTAVALLNGHATDAVYSMLSLDARREHGIFFSGASWAQTLVTFTGNKRWKRFVDPSAGTGDLLLEICKSLPLETTLPKTLKAWRTRLVAVDLRASFVQIAWARIQALAIHRHKMDNDSVRQLDRAMPASFRSGDALTLNISLRSGDCIIMNPPYHRMEASPDSFVGTGQRSAAALHVERMLRIAPPGVGVVVLVPDVLRSGSSYKNFRNEVENRLKDARFKSLGRFGPAADVDVAVLTGITPLRRKGSGKSTGRKKAQRKLSTNVVGGHFDVSVGAVVPHRTVEKGREFGYLTTKNAPRWGTVASPSERGTFEATTVMGPFVVVRRTSSPSDRQRAKATLVSCRQELLVENHLIVCKPISGTLKDCRRLVRVLRDARTTAWLNKRIRCRHLTVGAMQALPWNI